MSPREETNACNACAKAKRKCGRQLPSCARCVARDRSCAYPQSKSKTDLSSRPLLPNISRGSTLRAPAEFSAEFLAEGARNIPPRVTNPIPPDRLIVFPLTNSDFTASPSDIQTIDTSRSSTDWFLAPETWEIAYREDTLAEMPVGKAAIKKFVVVMQSWLQRWVTTGSNPFIHHCLYSAHTPACVQVAYATLVSYLHRTPANTDTILQIVEDRSNNLLEENGAVADGVGLEPWTDRGDEDIDLFAQLSRLHALMVYQFIGLFDGDIRSRHVAQGHMAIQDSWAGKLLRSAERTLSNNHSVAVNALGCLPTPSTSSQQRWYLWILSESIRRTWLIAAGLSPIFFALQQLWAPCPGRIKFTASSGPWSAMSAAEWEKQCLGQNGALLQGFECGMFFEDDEVPGMDGFGTAFKL